MTLQVLMPQRDTRQVDTLAKALDMAHSLFGIEDMIAKRELHKFALQEAEADAKEKSMIDRGVISPRSERSLIEAGFELQNVPRKTDKHGPIPFSQEREPGVFGILGHSYDEEGKIQGELYKRLVRINNPKLQGEIEGKDLENQGKTLDNFLKEKNKEDQVAAGQRVLAPRVILGLASKGKYLLNVPEGTPGSFKAGAANGPDVIITDGKERKNDPERIKRLDKYYGAVDRIDEEYRGVEKILRMASLLRGKYLRKELKLDNPTDQFLMMQIVSPLADLKSGVVRTSDINLLESQKSLYESFMFRLKKIKDGGTIPDQVVTDMFKSIESLRPAIALGKYDKLDAISGRIANEGLADSLDVILGDQNSKVLQDINNFARMDDEEGAEEELKELFERANYKAPSWLNKAGEAIEDVASPLRKLGQGIMAVPKTSVDDIIKEAEKRKRDIDQKKDKTKQFEGSYLEHRMQKEIDEWLKIPEEEGGVSDNEAEALAPMDTEDIYEILRKRFGKLRNGEGRYRGPNDW